MTEQTKQTYTIFMLVRANKTWLALPPKDRFAFVDDAIRPILAAHRTVSLRFFDAEAFHAQASDVMMWSTDDLGAYMSLVEGLRETAFWGHYFEVVDILPSVENGFARHYGVDTLEAA